MFGEPAALLVGIVSTLGTVALTIWASRRFGLPGLAREVDTQSAKLIDRLTQNNALLTTQNAALAEQNTHLVTENRDLRAKLATAYADIATLYRATGKTVPEHVLANQSELQP